MKTRNSFVSNSSSSSFVISFDKDKEIDTVCPRCKRGFKARNLEEVAETMFGQHDDDFSFDVLDEGHIKIDDWMEKEKKEKILKELKAGKIVARLSFNMHREDAQKEYIALKETGMIKEISRNDD